VTTSYVIVHGGTEPARTRNLEFLLRHLAATALEIVVVEQDTTPRLSLGARVRHVFCHNPGRFNRAWGFNVGAKAATGERLICGDNDVVIPATTLRTLPRSDRLIIPYRRCLDLSEEATRGLQETGVIPEGEGAPRGEWTVGGAFVIARASYLAIGGMCEDFEGCGAEDDAFYDRCKKTIGVLRSRSLLLYHMHHERAAARDGDADAYNRNVRLLRRELAKTPRQLRAERATRFGDPDKYIKRAILKSRRAVGH
jgi:hypothetical protein